MKRKRSLWEMAVLRHNHARTKLAMGYLSFMEIEVQDGDLCPQCTGVHKSIHLGILVGRDWLKKHLTKKQFANYVAERLLR